jgi:hypothetical protein
MQFSENRLVWQDKAPEGNGEAVDSKAKAGVEVSTKPDVPAATQEAKMETQALADEVAATVAKEEKKAAEDAAAGVDTPASGGNTPPIVPPVVPIETEDVEDVEKEELGEKIKKIIGLIIAYFVGSKAGSSETVDAERVSLVTAYQGVVDKLQLPVTVEEADIGVLKGQKIEDAAQLEAFFNGKAKVEGLTAKVSLRDYLNKLKKVGTPATSVSSDAAPAAAGATVAAAEVAPTAPASPFKNCPDSEIDMTSGASCPFELASGGEVILDGETISTGGKDFKVEATTDAGTAQVKFDKIWPIANGGYGLTITPMGLASLAAGSQNVELPQDKVVALVSALAEGGKQDRFTYDVVNPADGETVKFAFEKA